MAYDDDDSAVHAWVNSTLQSRLEEPRHGPAYRLCLLSRDTVGGVDIAAAIYDGIQHSRMTLLIVGKTYYQDMWSSLMFRMARQHTFKDPNHHLVIILMDENMHHVCQRDRLLQVYIDLGQYLVVTRHLFWHKLLNKLAKKPSENEPEMGNGEFSALLLPNVQEMVRLHEITLHDI